MEVETLSLKQGYLVKAQSASPLPAVLVIHEWWGLNDHIKDICARLGKEGFVALAPDLYGGRVTQDAGEASRWMGELNTDAGMRIIEEDFKYLQEQPFVKRGGIGIMGFCMGGSFALLAACRLKDLKASVSFYGHYPEEVEEIQKIKCPVLFFAGGKDAWINAEVVGKIKGAFKKYQVNGTIQIYPEADHAFFNDTRPEVYDRVSAHEAWKRTVEFLKENLGTVSYRDRSQ